MARSVMRLAHCAVLLIALAGCTINSGLDTPSPLPVTATASATAMPIPLPTTTPTRAATATPAPTIAATATPTAEPWSTLRRPLTLPRLAPGVPCPRAAVLGPPAGYVVGPGPFYPNVNADGFVHLGGPPDPEGWYTAKLFWSPYPTDPGPALVRGQQLDGEQNAIRFQGVGHPPPADPTGLELHLEPQTRYDGTRWATYTLLRAPGCYAYQVDGTTFSYTIVFQAVLP